MSNHRPASEMPSGGTSAESGASDPMQFWIDAPSKRKAMDWALVLASQSIEAKIEATTGSHGTMHGLLVRLVDAQAATESIEAYQRENKFWRWRSKGEPGGILLDPSVLIWVVLLAAIHFLDDSTGGTLTARAAASSVAVSKGEWWRLFTAVFLHADIGHLAANLSVGSVLLGLAMGRFGGGLAALGALVAGAAGNAASWAIYSHPFTGVGASGLVFGALGLLAGGVSFGGIPSPGEKKLRLGGLAAGLFLLALLGTNPSSDHIAHLGGFLAGLIQGPVASVLRQKYASGNFTYSTILLIICISVWSLAFK